MRLPPITAAILAAIPLPAALPGCGWSPSAPADVAAGRDRGAAPPPRAAPAALGVPARAPVDAAPIIVAADAAIGARPGVIDVPPGDYVISGSEIVLHAGHRLHLGAGHYDPLTPVGHVTFLMQDDTTIEGEGWDRTVIVEPISMSFANDYETTVVSGQGEGNQRLTVHDLRFVRREGPLISGCCPGTIGYGNSKDVTVHDVWFDGTVAYSVESGAPALAGGGHGGDLRVTHCRFRGQPMPLAVVNTDGFLIADSEFEETFYGVDVEPNTQWDVARHGTIIGNGGDSFSVLIQGAVTGDILVAHNVLRGIAVFNADHVSIEHNEFPAQGAPARVIYGSAYLGGAERASFEWNTMVDRGWPDLDLNSALTLSVDNNPDFSPHPTILAVVRHNSIGVDAGQIGSATIRESRLFDAASGVSPDRNDVSMNVLGPASQQAGAYLPGRVILLGPGSAARGNVFPTAPR